MLLVDSTLLNLHNSSLWLFVTRLHYYSMSIGALSLGVVECLGKWGASTDFLGLKVNLELSR